MCAHAARRLAKCGFRSRRHRSRINADGNQSIASPKKRGVWWYESQILGGAMRRAVVLLASLSFTNIALPHGVGLDSRGSRHIRKAGGYHRHRGVMVGQSFASKDG